MVRLVYSYAFNTCIDSIIVKYGWLRDDLIYGIGFARFYEIWNWQCYIFLGEEAWDICHMNMLRNVDGNKLKLWKSIEFPVFDNTTGPYDISN